MKKKTIALLMTVAIVLVCAIGGTLAWLTDKSDAVINTFSASDINITLEESENLDLTMIPGHTITKDPKATVVDDSEECFLFVKLDKSENFDAYMTYEVAEGWTALNDADNDGIADDGIYYREVTEADMGKAFSILKNNQVMVKGEVSKEQMNALLGNTYPTLTVTAYASQLYKNSNNEKFTAAEAWDNVPRNVNP